VESEFCERTGKNYHFLKDMSLRELRENIDQNIQFVFDDVQETYECIGICDTMS